MDKTTEDTTNPALAALRYHVTGAIERGEAEPIVEQPADPFAGLDVPFTDQEG